MKIIKNLSVVTCVFLLATGYPAQASITKQLNTVAVEKLIDNLLDTPENVQVHNGAAQQIIERKVTHSQIAAILKNFVDMKDKKNSFSYFEQIMPLTKKLVAPYNEDETLLIELVAYLNSSASKNHMDFSTYINSAVNTSYWLGQLATVPILGKAMRLIVKLLNADSATKNLAPHKKEWRPQDVDLASIIVTKATYK